MRLEDYQKDMETCCRCSLCKFIPLEKINSHEYAYSCPSIARYHFNAYSGGGRLNIGLSLLEGRIDYNNDLLDILYKCHMCGACDVSCKYAMDMDVLDPINEIRIMCVSEGHTIPALDARIKNLRENASMVFPGKITREQYSRNLDVKNVRQDKARVLFHAGCRTCFDEDMWKGAESAIKLLTRAGVDLGIMGNQEKCCGGRALQMGYKEDFLRQARLNSEGFRKSGATVLITACAECYHAFKVLYPKYDMDTHLEVIHVTEYLAGLINEGKLKPSKKIPIQVTYHDPCHLGRQGEPYIPWEGKMMTGQIRKFDPSRPFRRGTHGLYEPPRKLLETIPGLKLVEMARTREYSWCCGAGGGVRETNPEFAEWTTQQRIEEAVSSGAEALVTSCPGCEKQFKDIVRKNCVGLKVFTVTDLLENAMEEGGC